MNKELLKQFQLQAGGSHYPEINPQMQEAFARLIVQECIDAVRNTKRQHANTTFDLNMVETTIAKSINAIEERFQYRDFQTPPKPY